MPRSTQEDDLHPQPWHFLVLRSQNLRLLRPERSWRPIVTVDVDKHHSHELVLGVDGQNPNLRAPIVLHDVHDGSLVDVKVWYKSSSKAKSRRKRHLVGSASTSLGEVSRRQGNEPHVDLRLSCTSPHVRKAASTSKQQTYASLLVRVRAPYAPSHVHRHDDDVASYGDDRVSIADSSDDSRSSSGPSTPLLEPAENPPPWDQSSVTMTEEPTPPSTLSRRRRRKIKPFCIDSDSDSCSISASEYTDGEDENPDRKPVDPWSYGDDIELRKDGQDADGPIAIVLPSELPSSYIRNKQDNMSITPSMASSVTRGRAFVDLFTYYRELREARVDVDFERVLGKLIYEWYWIGGSLIAVAALDTAIFGFSPDAIFSLDGPAKRSVTVSSIACAIGLFIDMWLVFAYSGADVQKFQTLAVDLYSSWFFFALTSRLPLLTLVVAVLALVVFLLVIAWDAWRGAVLVMSCVAGVLFSLQFIVFGVHCVALGIAWVVLRVWRGLVWVFRRRKGMGKAGARRSQPQGEEVAAGRARPFVLAPIEVEVGMESLGSVDVVEMSEPSNCSASKS